MSLHKILFTSLIVTLGLSAPALAYADIPSLLIVADDETYTKYNKFVQSFSGPFQIDRLTSNEEINSKLLSQYSVLVILEPKKAFSESEIKSIKNFVESGNYLVAIEGLTHTPDDKEPSPFQILLQPFDVGVSYSDYREFAKCYQAKGSEYFSYHPITDDVKSFSYCSAGHFNSIGPLESLVTHNGSIFATGNFGKGGLVVTTMGWSFSRGYDDTANFTGVEEEIGNKKIIQNLVVWLLTKVKPNPLENDFITYKLDDFAQKTEDLHIIYPNLHLGKTVFDGVPFLLDRYAFFYFDSGDLTLPVQKPASQVIVLMNGVDLMEKFANAPSSTTHMGDITGRIILVFENGLRLTLDVVVGENLRNYGTHLDITEEQWVLKTKASYVKNVYYEEVKRVTYKQMPFGDVAEVALEPDYLFLDAITINIPEVLKNLVLEKIIFEGNPAGYTNAFLAGVTVTRSPTPFVGYGFQVFGDHIIQQGTNEKSYVISFEPVSVAKPSLISISLLDIAGINGISIAVFGGIGGATGVGIIIYKIWRRRH